MKGKIEELLDIWREHYQDGIELSAAELTIDSPELKEELEEEIAVVRADDLLVENMFGGFVPDEDVFSRDSEIFEPKRPEDFGLPDIVGDKFELREYIDSGSFGIVWKAYDRKIKREVAIKFPSSTVLHNKNKLAFFKSEAEIMARFQHSNVVTIYELGETETVKYGVEAKCPFIVMELMDGSLKDHLKDWVDRSLEAAEIIQILSDVLHSAHNYKTALIHRDIKPNNILVKKNQSGKIIVKLTDFGLATNRNIYYKDEDLKLFGAIGFIPPERIERENEDVRGDIYSLGVVLYILLTGDTSFIATNTHTLNSRMSVQRNCHAGYLPLATVNPVLSDYPELVAVCEKAMAFKPDDRYNNAREFSKALKEVIEKYRNAVEDVADIRKNNSSSYFVFTLIILAAILLYMAYHYFYIRKDLDNGAVKQKIEKAVFSERTADPQSESAGKNNTQKKIVEKSVESNIVEKNIAENENKQKVSGEVENESAVKVAGVVICPH